MAIKKRNRFSCEFAVNTSLNFFEKGRYFFAFPVALRAVICYNPDALLDERFLRYPSVALEQAFTTLSNMYEAAAKNYTDSVSQFTKHDSDGCEKIRAREDTVDRYEDVLGLYLVKLSANSMNERETKLSAKILQSLTNIERISDHAMNLTELAEELHGDGISFSDEAKSGLSLCMSAVNEIIGLAQNSLFNSDVEAAMKVGSLEPVIDVMTEKLKAQHTYRLQQGKCTLKLGFIFNDALSNLERIADHCSNLALIVLESTGIMPHSYEKSLGSGINADNFSDAFVEKYLSFPDISSEAQ